MYLSFMLPAYIQQRFPHHIINKVKDEVTIIYEINKSPEEQKGDEAALSNLYKLVKKQFLNDLNNDLNKE